LTWKCKILHIPVETCAQHETDCTYTTNRFEKMGMIHKSKESIFVQDLPSLKAFYQNRTPLEQNKTLTLPQAI